MRAVLVVLLPFRCASDLPHGGCSDIGGAASAESGTLLVLAAAVAVAAVALVVLVLARRARAHRIGGSPRAPQHGIAEHPRQTPDVLDVLCAESELAEYAETIDLGDRIRRMGVRRRADWFGSGLDEVDHHFDRSAGVAGGLPPLAISGEVHAIAAIFLRSTGAGGARRLRAGSTLLEPLASTRDTRRPARSRSRSAAPPGVGSGWTPVTRSDGDEVLWGWRLTLSDADLEPW